MWRFHNDIHCIALYCIVQKPVIDSRSAEGETPGHLDGDIEFNDVVFAYPSRPDVQVSLLVKTSYMEILFTDLL